MIPQKSVVHNFSLPVLGLGTWQMWWLRDPDTSKDAYYIHAIRQNIDHGVSLIDVSEVYGNGHTEELIGAAIKNFSRDDIFLTSKVRPQNLAYHDCILACENSLRRLWVEYLDLYLIHKKNPDIDLAETFSALDVLVDRGLVRNIWVANFSKESLALAQKLSKHPIVLNQCHYNLLYREPEVTWLLEYCQQNGIIFQSWRPFQLWEILTIDSPSVNLMCQKYEKTPAQIALKWVVSQENVTAVAKMSIKTHIEENLWVFWWDMSKDDIEYLRTCFETQHSVSNLWPLL